MPALLVAIGLCRRQRVIKVVANQPDLDPVATKLPRLHYLLLRCRDRHENHPRHPEVLTVVGNPLRVVAGAGANKQLRVRFGGHHLAHRIERPA